MVTYTITKDTTNITVQTSGLEQGKYNVQLDFKENEYYKQSTTNTTAILEVNPVTWYGVGTENPFTLDNITYERTYSGGSDPTITTDGRLNVGLYRSTILNNIPLEGEFEVTITAEITTNNRHEIRLATITQDDIILVQKDVGSTHIRTEKNHTQVNRIERLPEINGVHSHTFKRVGDTIEYYLDGTRQASIPWEYDDTLYPGGLKWQSGNTFIDNISVLTPSNGWG